MNKKLDRIYDLADRLMREGRLVELDSWILNIKVDEYHALELIGFLTSTLPVRSKLPSRNAFCKAVEEALKTRGEWQEGLLKGLE